MPINLQKQITLTNRINFFMALLGIVEVSQFLLAENYLKGGIIFLPWLVTFAIPLLNSKGYHVFGRYFTAIGYPTYNILSNLYYKTILLEDGFLPFLEIIRPSLTLLVYIVIPLAVFDPVSEKKRLRISLALLIIYNLGYDTVNNYFGVGVMSSDWQYEGYDKLVIFKAVLITALIAIISSIKRVNLIFENKLKDSNINLQIKSEEVFSQNEELQQQQEEILMQREAIQSQNEILSVKNQQVEDSVRAAESIQKAILPDGDLLDQILKPQHYFILYKPKDIVSGDFYWAHTANGYNFLATIDCTGHGVPGAFMTLISHALLDQIIKVQHIIEPKDILDVLNAEIRGMLRQENQQNQSGMEMSICRWETLESDANTEVVFAGAKSNLFIYRPGDLSLTIHKGTRRGIGGPLPRMDKPYQQQSFILPKGSRIYTYTDGYVDQNNEQRKRLGIIHFKALLESGIKHSIAQQKELLEQGLLKHQGTIEQRDDICIIGVEF